MNSDNLTPIPIFFTIDDRYAPLLGTALKSLIMNASKTRRYKIFIICENVSAQNADKLKALARDHVEIETMSMSVSLQDITDRTENHLRCDYFTMTIFFRLFLPEMFPQFDKGIYLDSDIVVPGDISELYDTDLGDNLIAASPDHSVSDVPPLVNWIERAVGVNRYRYINSGVLVMNMKKLREVRMQEHFMYLLNTYHFDSIAPDQDYLNAMCEGKIRFLDEEWDVMPNPRKPEFRSPKLIHYNLFDKPWYYEGVQYADYFWDYARISGFIDRINEIKDNYTDQDREHDKQSLAMMIHKAETVPDTGITFVKMAENDVRIKL